jgi:trigger factor
MTNITKLPKSEVKITFQIAPEELAKARKTAVAEFAKEVKIDGFRPGKAPEHLVVEKFGEEVFTHRAQDIAIQKQFVETAMKENLVPLTRPVSKVLKEEPLEIEITFAVNPEINLDGYEKISVPAEKTEVTEAEVQEVLDHVQKRAASYEEANDRAAIEGDRVEIDFEGFDEKGESLPSTKSSNHPLVIGEKMFVPGFEENVIGMKLGEEKTFEVTFPVDYHEESFKNKKVTFKVTAKNIEKRTVPDWNAELVQANSSKSKDFEEYKKEVRDDLEKAKKQQASEKRISEYFDKLIEHTNLELSDELIAQEAQAMVEDMKKRIADRGIDWDTYLRMTKKENDQIITEFKLKSDKELKIRFLIRAIIDKEKLEVTPEEVDNEIEKMIAEFDEKKQKQLRKEAARNSSQWNQIANNMLLEKLFAKILPE